MSIGSTSSIVEEHTIRIHKVADDMNDEDVVKKKEWCCFFHESDVFLLYLDVEINLQSIFSFKLKFNTTLPNSKV